MNKENCALKLVDEIILQKLGFCQILFITGQMFIKINVYCVSVSRNFVGNHFFSD